MLKTSTALVFVGGFALGLALAFRLRRTTDGKCCERVAQGVRDRVGEACGIAGSICQGAGDWLDIWKHSPDLLDALGVH